MQGSPSPVKNCEHVFTDTMDADTILYYTANQTETTSAEIHQLLGNSIDGASRYFINAVNGEKTLPETSSLHGSSSELSEIFTENDQADFEGNHLLDDIVLKNVTVNSPVKPKKKRKNFLKTEIIPRRKRQSQDQELPRLRKRMMLTHGGCALGEDDVEHQWWKCQQCSAVFKNRTAFYLHRVIHRKKKAMNSSRIVDVNSVPWNRTRQEYDTDSKNRRNDDETYNSCSPNKISGNEKPSETLLQKTEKEFRLVSDDDKGTELTLQNNVYILKSSKHEEVIRKEVNNKTINNTSQFCARTLTLDDAIQTSQALKYSEKNKTNNDVILSEYSDDGAQSVGSSKTKVNKHTCNDFGEFFSEQPSLSDNLHTSARILPIYEAIATATLNNHESYSDDEYDYDGDNTDDCLHEDNGENDQKQPDCYIFNTLTPNESLSSVSTHGDNIMNNLSLKEHGTKCQYLEVGTDTFCNVSNSLHETSKDLLFNCCSRVVDFETHLKIIRLQLCARVQPYLINIHKQKSLNCEKDYQDGSDIVENEIGSDNNSVSEDQDVIAESILDDSRHIPDGVSESHIISQESGDSDCARTKTVDFHQYSINKLNDKEVSEQEIKRNVYSYIDSAVKHGNLNECCPLENGHQLRYADRTRHSWSNACIEIVGKEDSCDFDQEPNEQLDSSQNNSSLKEHVQDLSSFSSKEHARYSTSSFIDCDRNCESSPKKTNKHETSYEDKNCQVTTVQCGLSDSRQSSCAELIVNSSCSRVQTFHSHMKLKQSLLISVGNRKNIQENICQSSKESHHSSTLATMPNVAGHLTVQYTCGESQTLSSLDEEDNCVTYETHVDPISDGDKTVTSLSNVQDLYFKDNQHFIYNYYRSPKKRWWDTYINEKD